MPEIIMPRLSDTMEDGVVAGWLKQVGDRVTRGEIIAEIETDKALMELEAYDDGVLEQILVEAGTRIPIGEPIGIVGDGSGSSVSVPAPSRPVATGTPQATESAAQRQAAATAGGSNTQQAPRKKTSPLARKVARELGVDIDTVVGTGPGGRITRQDVETAHQHYSAATESAPALPRQPARPGGVSATSGSDDVEEVPLTGIQRVSAARLTESKQQAPHIYLTSAIDVTELLAFRSQLNETLAAVGENKVSVNDLLVKSAALTLGRVRSVNVSLRGDTLLRHKRIHIGVAVATPEGLLVPVIDDADRKSVSEIAAETRDKATRARERTLRAHEMSGGTFTISNLGMFGIEHFTAVINPPESAILAVGAAADELRLDNGAVVSRKILRVTLSADHRAIDGAVAAEFLAQLKQLLENPLRIVA
ncbi:dihydrolipoamide acetyltransferase family protein [Nocardia halotolerans]|uniref:Dihydrolipoamide acetyltransferase component of pyruvate dehydrogenase complex n=1 Tax=Nocardia halotolerans TaxID=1755878 RepID=A0ABV8VRB7_9NOCA